MRKARTIRVRRREMGIALLISIFILLLISIVAIALIVASGTESALAGNYRSSTGVYYAALAGLEEARGRLSTKNPNPLKTAVPAYFPAPGTAIPIGSILYVLNPGPTDNLATMLANYPDTEYDNEFGGGALAAATGAGTVKTTTSVWNMAPLNGLVVPGPFYKWVRINPISEKSLGVNFDGNPNDATDPVYYDSTAGHPSLTPTGSQILEVTSFAQLPNGSQKIVQYLVAPGAISLPVFPAALTLAAGPLQTVTFNAPTSNPLYYVSGNDISVPLLPSCTPGAAVDAIAAYHTNAVNAVSSSISGNPSGNQTSYTGIVAHGTPDVWRDPIANYQTPSQLDALAQSIIQNADAVVPPGSAATQTAYLTSLGMSPSKLLTVVANGDLDVSNWNHDGYGLLLVTGTFWYDPDTNWNGIILVIGQGKIMNSQNGQFKQINGAVLVAQTRDALGNLLPDPDLGSATVSFLPGMQGDGMRYSSCWIKAATPAGSYKTLSFHEISQ